MIDFDGSWKDVLDFFLTEFLAFFFPDILADIDWTSDPVALEQEFRASSARSFTGPMRCDKLLRVVLREEEEAGYLHIEVQCQVESEFPRRAFDYNQGATRHYSTTVATLVILGDETLDWRPAGFTRERWGCANSITFRPIKLLDYRGREEELEQHANPVAVVVLTHLKAIETHGDLVERRAWRLRLARRVYQRAMDDEDRLRLLAIVERLLDLPEELEAEILSKILNEREEPKMPYVTSFERHFKKEGREEGLREGILALIEFRFGTPDAGFLALLNQAHLTALEALRQAAKTGTGLDELRALLAPTNGQV